MSNVTPIPHSQPPAVSEKRSSKEDLVSECIEMLMSAYRKVDYANPDGFVIQLAMVLAAYPDETIRHVTHPLTGVQRTLKFPPSIAEVAEACERLERHKELERLTREHHEHLVREAEARQRALEAERLKRIALAHLWMRAQEAGDPQAAQCLRSYAYDELLAARGMTMTEAVTLIPEARAKMSKPADHYGPLRGEERSSGP